MAKGLWGGDMGLYVAGSTCCGLGQVGLGGGEGVRRWTKFGEKYLGGQTRCLAVTLNYSQAIFKQGDRIYHKLINDEQSYFDCATCTSLQFGCCN